MVDTKKLNVSEVDFFQIKENLKAYLRNQPEFTDYDFDGSAMNTLLDILAYSTHYNAVHTNLGFAETFLDSAVQRGSVVSRAKELGYVPRSASAAKAIIRVSFAVTGNPAQYILPKGTRFTSSASGETLTFVTIADHIIENNGANVFTDLIEVYQGKFASYTYTVNLNDAAQRFLVAAKNADTRFLTVLHKDTAATSVYNEYSFINDLSIGNLKPTTQVYFLRETFDGFYEVYFGDNTIGKAVENGNVIQLTYLITDGALANGAKQFALGSSLAGVSSVSVTTVDQASGGGEKESIESIKYLAPFYYQSQGRAVTEDDYKALILNNYADVDDIAVWGGERNDPPFYGKVFIAIKPKATLFFSNAVKQTIQNDIISRFNIVSVRPEIVNPDYIDVAVETTVTYNGRLYNSTSNADLAQDIEEAIEGFFLDEANKFAQPLYYSKLVATIDNVSTLILNSTTNLTLSKSREIIPSISAEYKFCFNNSIHPNAVRSNDFIIDGVTWKIKDLPQGTSPFLTGTLAIYRLSNEGVPIYLTQNAGTVDYNTGIVTLVNTKIDSIVNDNIYKLLTISVAPGAFNDPANTTHVFTDQNVYTNDRDQIIRLKTGGVSIVMIPDNAV